MWGKGDRVAGSPIFHRTARSASNMVAGRHS